MIASSSTYQFLLKHATSIVLTASVVLFFANIWNIPLYILDEAKNAECAREMWEQGEWIIPTFNYELRPEKPPLHYYFMAAAYTFFGVNPFAARFFSAIMGILTVWITFFFVRRELGVSAAFCTALVLLASIHNLVQFHLSVPDPYLIFSITLSMFSFYLYIEHRKSNYLWIGYITAATGVLAKGPVALGLIGLTMLLYLIFSQKLNLKTLKALRIPLGGVLFLAIVLPWYILVDRATAGEWTQEFFFTQNFSRFGSAMEGHGGGFWLTWIYVLVGLFPFSILLPQTLHWSWKMRQQPFLKLCLIAGLVIVGFFTISSTKLPNYTVPAYPFLAVLMGYFLHTCLNESGFWQKYRLNWSFVIGLLIVLVLVVGGYYGIQSYSLIEDYAMGLLIFLPCALGFMMALIRKNYWLYSIASGAILTALLLFYYLLPNAMSQNPVQHSSTLLENKELVAYKRFNPAYVFHFQREIPTAETPEELRQMLNEKTDVHVLTFTKYGLEFSELGLDTLFLEQDLFEATKTLILRLED